MTPEQYIKANLLTLAFREAAHYGGTDNMQAVMFVVRNRVHAGWQGADWIKVMADHYKFKAESKRHRLLEYPDLRDPVIREIMLPMVDDVYSGMLVDNMTDGALFYAELDKVKSAWFRRNILDRLKDHRMIARVGPVTFFR